MGYFILSVLAAIGIFIWVGIANDWDMWPIILIAIALCWVLTFGLVELIADTCYNEDNLYTVEETFDIVAFKDNSQINGAMFFHRCYLKEDIVYYYMREYDGFLKMEHIPAGSTMIRRSDKNEAYIKTIRYYAPKNFFRIEDTCVRREYFATLPSYAEITNDFVVDME